MRGELLKPHEIFGRCSSASKTVGERYCQAKKCGEGFKSLQKACIQVSGATHERLREKIYRRVGEVVDATH